MVSEHIPFRGRRVSDIEREREKAIHATLSSFGLVGLGNVEELRRRCVIVHYYPERIERLQIDGIPRLEWGYLDNPNTWTVRTVEPKGKA